MRPDKTVEAIRYHSPLNATRYKTDHAGDTIVGSDAYDVQGDEERGTPASNTFLYKTALGNFYSVQYFSDPNTAPILTPLTEPEAMHVWSDLAAGGASPDKIPFNTVFPGYTISWA